jgi:hypothetical protein
VRSTPSTSLPVGDRVKLSTDGLRVGDAASYAHDVLLLGELWQQSLMSASPKSSEIVAHATDPKLGTRWSVAEIRASLEAPLPTVEPPAMPDRAPSPPPSLTTPSLTTSTLPPPNRRSVERIRQAPSPNGLSLRPPDSWSSSSP